MVAKEFSTELDQEKTNLIDFDDEEETLSLCDLAVDSSAAEYWNAFKEDDQSSSSNQDLFEFFNTDSTASAYPRDNIVFCGKIISHKELTVTGKTQLTEIPTKQEAPKKSRGVFKCKSHSLGGSRVPPSPKVQWGKSYKRSISMPMSSSCAKYDKKFDYSVKNISIPATPMKSRWYLFAFGMGRFPKEMELRDMRKRQSNRRPVTMFQFKAESEIVKGSTRRKNLWGLIRSLMCRNQPAGVMVKTSFGCIPLV